MGQRVCVGRIPRSLHPRDVVCRLDSEPVNCHTSGPNDHIDRGQKSSPEGRIRSSKWLDIVTSYQLCLLDRRRQVDVTQASCDFRVDHTHSFDERALLFGSYCCDQRPGARGGLCTRDRDSSAGSTLCTIDSFHCAGRFERHCYVQRTVEQRRFADHRVRILSQWWWLMVVGGDGKSKFASDLGPHQRRVGERVDQGGQHEGRRDRIFIVDDNTPTRSGRADNQRSCARIDDSNDLLRRTRLQRWVGDHDIRVFVGWRSVDGASPSFDVVALYDHATQGFETVLIANSGGELGGRGSALQYMGDRTSRIRLKSSGTPEDADRSDSMFGSAFDLDGGDRRVVPTRRVVTICSTLTTVL